MVSSEHVRQDGNVNIPWVEKYRPASLTELIAHEEITNTRKLQFLSLCYEKVICVGIHKIQPIFVE